MAVSHVMLGTDRSLEAILRAQIADLLGERESAPDDDINLFELGLDSIRLMQLADRLQQAGLEVGFLELAREPRLGAWLELLRARGVARPEAEPVAVPAVDPSLPFSLTPVQQSYWVGRGDDQPLGGVGCHAYLELDGPPVDPRRLETAVRALIRRHGMLRARFLPDGTQQIFDDSPWPGLAVHDLRDLDEAAETEAVEALRESLAHRCLDVGGGEVFDVQLTLLPNGAGRLHVNIDLLVCDVLSVRLLLTDLAELYARPAVVGPLDYTFPQYLADRAPRAEKDKESARTYWLERLATLPSGPSLPLASDPATVMKPRFNRRAYVLPAEVWRRLTQRAARHGLTPASMLATAFAEVLARWSGQDRFLLNVPLFDRHVAHPDTARLVADFTSLVLLEVDLSGGGFAERATRLQRRLHEDLEHTAFSGVEVLRELVRATVDGEPCTAPVVFACNIDGALVSDTCRSQFGDVGWMISQTPQVWLDHQVHLTAGGVLLAWDAVETLFPEGVLDAMFGAYLDLLAHLSVVAWEDTPELPLPEPQRVVREQVNSTNWLTKPSTLHSVFFELAAAQPDHPALCWGTADVLTYGELAERALRVAGAIQERGVRRGDAVAVTLPKGPDQIAAVLGVLAAGAAYVPIGVDQPPERQARMVDTACAVLVVGDYAGDSGPPVLRFDAATRATPMVAPAPSEPADIAYVIFTSGSTGVPKGVEIGHASAANTIDDINERLGVGPNDRVLALSALDFDLSVWDVFGMLTAGAGIVLVDEQHRRDPRAWLGLIRRHGVTLWNSVPVLMDMLLTTAGDEPLPPSLRCALLSGDWIGLDLPPRLARSTAGRCALLALGGATEGSIWSNAFDVDASAIPPHWRSIPYGLPLRNQRYRVVDGAGRDCPDWVPGELWIGGAGVARGYRDDPVHTAERFVGHGGSRWYRTGDLGRYRSDGVLEFLGRLDHQVKINGYRVELGEVETAVRAYPAVDSAVVVRTGGRLAALITEPNAVALPVESREPAAARAESCGLERELVAAALARLLAHHLTPRSGSWEADTGVDRGAVPLAPEYRPVLDTWIDLLCKESIIRCSGPVVTVGSRWRSVLSAEHWTGLCASARGTGLEPVTGALERALPLLAAVLRGDTDAAVFLDDPVLAPEALAQHLAGAVTCQTEVAKQLTRLAAQAGRPLRLAGLGARGGVAITAILRGVPQGSVDCVLLDESAALLESACARFTGSGHEARTARLVGGAVREEFVHAFDVVLACNSLHRYPNPGDGAVVARTLLVPGGTLFATETMGSSALALVVPALLEHRRYRSADARAAGPPAAGRPSAEDWVRVLSEVGLHGAGILHREPAGMLLLRAALPADASVVLPAQLRGWVARRLPEHMVPGPLAVAPSLPLSANGKVDRRVVGTLFGGDDRSDSAAEPVRPGLEQLVAETWARILGRPPAGRDDSFFSAGGDSLLATRVIALLRERTGIELPMREFFREPSAKGLAAALASRLGPDRDAADSGYEVDEGAV